MCVVCRARRASVHAAEERLVAARVGRADPLRCPLAVAINTRRTSALVDFGQSFAGESVLAASERRRRRGRGAGGRRSALCGRGGLGLKPPKDKTYK